MNVQESQYFLAYCPLWGASFDSDGVGFVGDNVTAYIPSNDEWSTVQKHTVWMERFRYDPWTLEGPKPPVCAVVAEEINEENYNRNELRNIFGDSMKDATKDAIVAIQLFKSGWFLDPELAEIIFNYKGVNERLVGPYRQASLAGNLSAMSQGFELKISELTTQGLEGAITKIWRLIRHYKMTSRYASVDISLENFRASYGYQLSATQRSSFLFTCINAIFGYMYQCYRYSPIPVAMSRTLEPGLISASSTNRLLTFSVLLSIVFHHFCQAGATLFQL